MNFPGNVFGLSDHTLTNHACFGAVALGASILERHYTDSRITRKGPDIICSMDEEDCKKLLKGIKILFDQEGDQNQFYKKNKLQEILLLHQFAQLKK